MRITRGRIIAAVALTATAAAGIYMVPASAADQTEASVPANSVGSSQVINESLWTQDINPAVVKVLRTPTEASVWQKTLNANIVTEDKLSPAVRGKLNSAAGKVKGLEADSPYPGATQLADHPGNGANSTTKWVGDNGATLQRAWVQCADGKTAIGGGYQRADEGVAAIKALQIVTSSPTQIEDGKEVYEPIEGDAAGSLRPNAWLVEGFNNGTSDLIVRPSVVCADLG